jgi:hypothetical protein
MTVTVCWSAKGGSGTTVVAAGLALATAQPALLVDLDGELPHALGVPDPVGQGLADWFSSVAQARAVLDVAAPLRDGVRLVPRGIGDIPRDGPRWPELRDFLVGSGLAVVVDAGCGEPPPGLVGTHRPPPTSGGDLRIVRRRASPVRSLLVTRACYLAIERARHLATPDAIVLVVEPGRSLRAADIARALGAPVIAEVDFDPAVARAVDAGLLAARLPKSLLRTLRGTIASPPSNAASRPSSGQVALSAGGAS